MTVANGHNENNDPVPFFTDTRSVSERLNAQQLAWRPHKDEGPQLLAGLVLDRGSYVSDFDGLAKPTAVILDAPTGDGVEWRVVGFHGWLAGFLNKHNPRIGDWVAVAYNGTRPARKAGESDAYTYRGVVERNPDGPLPAADKDALLEDEAAERERVLVQAEPEATATEYGPIEGDDWGGFGD